MHLYTLIDPNRAPCIYRNMNYLLNTNHITKVTLCTVKYGICLFDLFENSQDFLRLRFKYFVETVYLNGASRTPRHNPFLHE